MEGVGIQIAKIRLFHLFLMKLLVSIWKVQVILVLARTNGLNGWG